MTIFTKAKIQKILQSKLDSQEIRGKEELKLVNNLVDVLGILH
jgi:hypothetical protein